VGEEEGVVVGSQCCEGDLGADGDVADEVEAGRGGDFGEAVLAVLLRCVCENYFPLPQSIGTSNTHHIIIQ